MKCVKCGKEIGNDPNFCKYCGILVKQISISADSMNKPDKCRKCGAVLKPRSAFCTQCGTPILAMDDNIVIMEEQKKTTGRNVWKITIAFITVIALTLVIFIDYYFVQQYGVFSRIRNRIVDAGSYTAEDDELINDESINEEAINEEIVEDVEAEEFSNDINTLNEEDVALQAEDPHDRTDTEMSFDSYDTNATYYEISSENIYTVSASSYLEESKYNLVHLPEKVVDGDLTTGWVEGVSGQGIGETITIYFDGEYLVSGIEIYAGYHKSDDLYNKNSRPKEVYIEFSDGTAESHTLNDINDAQNIQFENPTITESITLRIDSVYPGNKYEDTVITEILPY